MKRKWIGKGINGAFVRKIFLKLKKRKEKINDLEANRE